MAIKYFFDFVTGGHGKKYITEPQGMDAADFNTIREKGRLGMDVSYAGSEGRFRIGRQERRYNFKRMLQYWDMYGQEAVVYFGIEYTDTDYVIGQVDFNSCTTDRTTYFEFSTKKIGKVQLFNSRYDVQTDLSSYQTLDGKNRTPIQKYKMLAPAKPVTQQSSWKAAGNPINRFLNFNTGNLIAFIAPFPQQVKYGIDDSLSPFSDFFPIGSITNTMPNDNSNRVMARQQSTLIRATKTLTNLKVRISDFNLIKSSTGFVQTEVQLFWGQGYSAGQFQFITLYTSNANVVELNNAAWNVTIPLLNNTDVLWVNVAFTNLAGATTATANVQYHSGKIEITATATAYNSTVDMVRVADVMVENAFRTSETAVSAPRWQRQAGLPDPEFYNDFMTTQNMMRGLNKPLNISTKEIVEDYLPFCFGDYVSLDEDNVGYFRYPDFFQDFEMGNFPQAPVEGYEESLYEEANINRFSFKFSTFESQKENESANTQDEVHAELEDLLVAKQSINKKEVNVGGVRSAFSIEIARQKSYLEASAATQDDNKKYYIYCRELPINDPRRTIRTTATLQHQATGTQLILTNRSTSVTDENGNIQGEFSWRILGIEVGSIFTINSSVSTGTFTVVGVTDRTITLNTPGGSPGFVASDNTTFTYKVGASITHIWETDELLQTVENISDGKNYINLRATARRCVLKYYSEYLATNLIHTPFGEIKNTLYNNNPQALTRFVGDDSNVIEGASYRATGAILGSRKHSDMRLVMTIFDYLQLQTDIPNKRGFIKVQGADGYDIKIFPTKLTFKLANDIDGIGKGFALLDGVEKYEIAVLRIFRDGINTTINERIMPSDFGFTIDGYGKIRIFAANGKDLFPPVYWNRVSVNGVVVQSEAELQQALQ